MIRFRDTAPDWSCAGQGNCGSGWNAQCVDVPVQMWDPLGSSGIAKEHSQSLFL